MKQKIKIWIILGVEFIALAAMLLLIFFAGKRSYTVTFDLNGGTLLSGETVQKVTQGHHATPPKVTKDGCYFLEWSTSYREVTKDLVIKAIWEYETTEGIEYSESENSNYCEIVGCYKELSGVVYIGAYHGEKKVLGIRAGAFEGCENITQVYLLDGILAIEENAFRGCVSLESIELPASLVTLGDNAFSGCTALQEVVLPPVLKRVGAGAFSGCTALQEVLLPESLLHMKAGVFDTAVTVNTYYTQENKPKDWAYGWYTGKATVVWGYTDPVEDEEEDAEDEKRR